MKRDLGIVPSAEKEIAALPARFKNSVRKAINDLAFQADVTTKHRYALKGSLVPHWQAEAGAYRIYYVFDAVAVVVRAVRLKGNKRTEEVFKP